VSFVAEIPVDAAQAELMLGLEQTTGKAWFDEIKITVVGRRRPVPVTKPSAAIYKGHAAPRLRGAMVSPRTTADDLRILAGWKANHIRFQLTWGGFPRSPADQGDLAAYDAWLESTLAHLDELLPLCRELGIKVLIDLHTPPGGRNDANECRMFHERRLQEAFLAVWDKIARRYRGEEAVWGYDLVNEPVEGEVGKELLDWRSLALRAAQQIRRLDPDHAIVVEPAPWGSPTSLDWFEPLPVDGIVYSVHMYQPHAFTHQGVYDAPTGINYPGVIDGRHYDRAELRKALQPAIDYQRDYGVHIYIGEFSAIRWAPGDSAENYLRDCIELFEEQGWDWAYHAFREWDGWSVEHDSDPDNHRPAAQPTGREKLLRGWYGRNESAR
jgi:aryl-phospho-beta-D-glucosidase BglC (GH1 family)